MGIVGTLHKTLIIRFSSVGDIILSSLLIRVFHKRFPDCRIDYCAKAEYADLVRHNPHLSGVIEFPAGGGLRDLWRLRHAIRNNHYDLIIDIHDSLRSRLVCFGSRHVVRVRKRKLARFLLVKVKWNLYEWFGGAPGVAERYLETVHFLGVKNDGNGLEVFFPSAASTAAQEILADASIGDDNVFIGISPSARHFNKTWPRERFAETACTIAREQKASVLLFGFGKDEESLCQEVKLQIERLSPGIVVMNLADRLSLSETAAMMDHCSIVITNDSGLMHLAAARKRKVVAIFGPTVRELGFFPYGTESTVTEDTTLSCRPCTHVGLSRCPQGHFNCMRNISPVQVVDAARELLTRAPVP